MPSDASPGPYTQVIDLTSRAQRKARREEVGELREPDPPLDPISLDDLPDTTQQVLHAVGWDRLMEVQQKAIPYILDGRDLIVQSRTGSGKTGAFLLPLFDRVDSSKAETQVLILTPTRELARQIHDEFERMKIATPTTNEIEAVLIYGGVGYGPQIDALKAGAQVAIGTPGRVLDLMEKGHFRTRSIHMLILDEADEMLSMGFLPDMEEIRQYLPDERRSYMFSATMPAKVRSMARQFLRDPGFLSLSSERVGVDEIAYSYYLVNPMDKDRTLRKLIELEEPESAIIFCNTKREVTYLRKFLSNCGYSIDEMSGDLSQKAREEAIDKLREGQLRLLVATDVAARGIDISDLSHVFVYDVPQDHEYLIHRSGRTARAGKSGSAIILATHEDEFQLKRMAHRYSLTMERHEIPEDPMAVARELLESRFDERNGASRDDVPDFLPLVRELAETKPHLLAQFVADLYQERLEEQDADDS